MKGLNEFDQVLNEDHQRSKTKQTKNRLTTYIEYLKKKIKENRYTIFRKNPAWKETTQRKRQISQRCFIVELKHQSTT